MRISPILSLYIGRHFLVSFFSLLSLFLLLVLLFDAIELLRRTASQPDVTFGIVIEMAILRLPHMGQETFPFAVLFGGMYGTVPGLTCPMPSPPPAAKVRS